MGRAMIWMILAMGVAVFVAVEIFLRQVFGFGTPLLYVADERIGYRLAPNQEVRRFGNRIVINDYSMRGEAIAPTRPIRTLRLLLLGDSIANGGWWTDHDETISALLQRQLSSSMSHHEHKIETVEVLNASANSWGPRNELAYVETYGCFESQLVMLLINTDDLFATAPTSVQVGRDRNYPAQSPPFALAEVISRYLLPADSIPELDAVRAEGGDRVGRNLDAIRQIQSRVTQQEGMLVLVLTPLLRELELRELELRELESSGSREYETKARDRLVTFTQKHQIPYLDMLPILRRHTDPESLYRDHIHFNPQGNQVITEQIIVNLLEKAIASL